MTLEYGQYYHIFNRGNNRETLFRNERNYHFFLDRYTYYIDEIADTYAYCLLPNHFHFLVKIKPKTTQAVLEGKAGLKPPSKYFSNLFNAYTKAINKAYQRTGSLFEKPFHRNRINSKKYMKQLVLYIHYNPQKHGIIHDYRNWPFSSYELFFNDKPSRIRREEVLELFGDLQMFSSAHEHYLPNYEKLDFDQD